MSAMFVIAIDDDRKAREFLKAVQEYKFVGYPIDKYGEGDVVIRKAPVLFMYITTPEGKCGEHAGTTTRTGQDITRKMRKVRARTTHRA